MTFIQRGLAPDHHSTHPRSLTITFPHQLARQWILGIKLAKNANMQYGLSRYMYLHFAKAVTLTFKDLHSISKICMKTVIISILYQIAQFRLNIIYLYKLCYMSMN